MVYGLLMPKNPPKTKVYLDTSVPNFLFEKKHLEAKIATEQLLEQTEKGIYKAYVSPLVTEELEATPDLNRRKELLRVLKRFRYVTLEFADEVFELADQYVNGKIIPRKYRKDAVHLAVAAYHKIPIVVSWNFKHMVKPETRRGVNEMNKKLGYPQIDIVSPFELVGV